MLIWSILLPSQVLSKQDPEKCSQELQYWSNSFTNIGYPIDRYSSMVSSSGLLINDLGNYDKCIQTEEADYFIIQLFRFPISVLTLCLPSSCFKQGFSQTLQIGQFIKTHYPSIAPFVPQNWQVQGVLPEKYYQQQLSEYSVGACLMIAFLSVFLILIFLATCLEVYLNQFTHPVSVDSEFIELQQLNSSRLEQYQGNSAFLEKLKEILLGFSVVGNTKKLFQNQGRKNETTSVLNGVRVLSIWWVISGHTLIFFIGTPSSNSTSFLDFITSDFLVIYFTGVFAVDTFFWLSGLLMAYLLVKEMANGKIESAKDFFMVYLHRFLRLTPLILFLMLLTWSLQDYLIKGPLGVSQKNAHSDCSDYWWTYILYINNFYPSNPSICYSITWYTANDMQFFIIGTIVILLYCKISKKLGLGLLAVFILQSIITCWGISSHEDFRLSLISSRNPQQFKYIYNKPYTRIGPYVLGMMLGLILYNYQEFKKTGQIYDKFLLKISGLFSSKIIRYSSLLVGLCMINLVIFVQIDNYQNPGDDFAFDSWGEQVNYAFLAWQRIVFVLGLSLVILPCLLGHFSWISAILGHGFWAPLAKITFAVYLFHLDVIQVTALNSRTNTYWSQFYLFKESVYFIVISSVFGALIVVLFEYPIQNIERSLRNTSQNKLKRVN